MNVIVKEYARRKKKNFMEENATRSERKSYWKLCYKKRKSYELFVKHFDGRKKRNGCGKTYKTK